MNGTNSKKQKAGAYDGASLPALSPDRDIYQERRRTVWCEIDPVLHLPQMLGLAMGVPVKDLGVQRHLVSVDPIVKAVEERKARAEKDAL